MSDSKCKFEQKVDCLHTTLNSKIDELSSVVGEVVRVINKSQEVITTVTTNKVNEEIFDKGVMRLTFIKNVVFENSYHRYGFMDLLLELTGYDKADISNNTITLSGCSTVVSTTEPLTPEFIGILHTITRFTFGLDKIVYNDSTYIIALDKHGDLSYICTNVDDCNDSVHTPLPVIDSVILESKAIPYQIMRELGMIRTGLKVDALKEIVRVTYKFNREYSDLDLLLKKVDTFGYWIDMSVEISGKIIQVR